MNQIATRQPLPALRILPDAELAQLPEAARAKVRRWTVAFSAFDRAQGVKRALEHVAQAAGECGASGYHTARRFYDKLIRTGGDCHVFVDPRFLPKAGSLASEKPEFLTHCKTLADQANRTIKSAWLELKRQWNNREAIPGFEGHPGWPKLPHGWNLDSFYRWSRRPKAEILATRQGRSALSREIAPIFTSRIGLWPMSHVQFDDMVHDHVCHDGRQIGRPVQLSAFDVFSGCLVKWGMMLRTEREDGTMRGLLQKDMLFLLAATFAEFGYAAQGTVIVAENATAAVPERVEKLLFDATYDSKTHRPLISVSRAPMGGDPALVGQYGGRAKGNFKWKSDLEGFHSLLHNRMDMLPGQTGLSVDRRPEQLHGMLKRNDALLRAFGAVQRIEPALAARMILPVVSFADFQLFARLVYAEINSRTDHELEGWEALNHMATEFRWAEDSTDWLPMERVLGLPDARREALAHELQTHAELTRVRRLSPAEVFTPAAKGLVKISPLTAIEILGDDLGVERTVDRGRFSFESAILGPGLHHYDAAYVDTYRIKRYISNGEKFLTFANPFDPRWLYLKDAAGRILGRCPRTVIGNNLETDKLRDQFKFRAGQESALLRNVNARQKAPTLQTIREMRHNAGIVRQAIAKRDGTDGPAPLVPDHDEPAWIDDPEVETDVPEAVDGPEAQALPDW